MIHRFNDLGMTSLDPQWAGGRPRRITTEDEAFIFIVKTAKARPEKAGRPSPTGASASCGSLNRFLRGWAGFFRIGNSALVFDKVRSFAVERLAIFVANLHRRRRRWGLRTVRLSPDCLGLVNLNGIVVAPRPNRAWRALVAEHRR